MSETKFTPGPWITSRDNHIMTSMVRGMVKPAGGDAGLRIVFTKSAAPGDIAYVVPVDGDNGNANARLIAAAPDLLACLNFVRMSNGWRYLGDEAKVVIAAAIARAEGQEEATP